jgi:hypothetical protein
MSLPLLTPMQVPPQDGSPYALHFALHMYGPRFTLAHTPPYPVQSLNWQGREQYEVPVLHV